MKCPVSLALLVCLTLTSKSSSADRSRTIDALRPYSNLEVTSEGNVEELDIYTWNAVIETHVKDLRHIRVLVIRSKAASGCVPHIRHLQKLEDLEIRCDGFTGEDLGQLASMPKLRRLRLAANLTEKGAQQLSHLTRLRTLGIYGNVNRSILEQLKSPPNLRDLRLSDHTTKLSDADLAPLGEFMELEKLYLNCHGLTGSGLQVLRRLPKMRSLDLYCQELNNEGIAEIGQLKGLVSLEFYTGRVTDAGLRHLANLSELRSLRIRDTTKDRANITGEGFAHLTKLEQLESLSLSCNQINGQRLEVLAALPRLREIVLDCSSLKDADMSALTDLPHLRRLVLVGTPITDAGLEKLKLLPSLREVIVDVRYNLRKDHFFALHLAPKISTAGIQKLLAALPKCKVTHNIYGREH